MTMTPNGTDPAFAEAFHAAMFGYSLSKAQGKLLAQGYMDRGVEASYLKIEVARLRAELDGQRAVIEKLTAECDHTR